MLSQEWPSLKLKRGDTLILATHNQGKLEEFKTLLSLYDLNINSSGNLGIEEPEETENTFEGNALLKAKYTAEKTGHISLADDSGLVVPALDGMPGVYSARWAGPERDFAIAHKKINDLLENKPRDAYFTCVLAVALPDGSSKIFEGQSHGELVWPTRGDGGFGYDSMFVPAGDSRTYAQMTRIEKSKSSHRTKAFKLFQETLLGAH
ncbi:MAG: RdgB/HAM1 family non-canonical purine NTP pyrophosphatase [Proteobacteria bacterium]|jgi:XTP/dITP diphosphohydrolase|nr:RdgB/HAM1 family non-canonical purine NTP pyrophosphatase [Pseudomonadota bacterium]